MYVAVRPQVRRARGLDVVDDLAHAHSSSPGEARGRASPDSNAIRRSRGCLRDRRRRIALRRSFSSQRGGVDARGLRRRDRVLVDHVDHAANLHLDGADVPLEKNSLRRRALLRGRRRPSPEHLDVLRVDELVDGLDAGVDPQSCPSRPPSRATSGSYPLPLKMTLECFLRRSCATATALSPASMRVARCWRSTSRPWSSRHGVHDGHVLRRPDGAELEAVRRRTGRATCGCGPPRGRARGKESTPRATGVLAACTRTRCRSMKSVRYSVICVPR